MELASRIETVTPARFATEVTLAKSLLKITLVDAALEYRSVIHVLATKDRREINNAKEQLAIDYLMSKGELYANKVRALKRKPFAKSRYRVRKD